MVASLPRGARRAVVPRIAFPGRQLVRWDYAYPKARRTRVQPFLVSYWLAPGGLAFLLLIGRTRRARAPAFVHRHL